MTYCYFRVTAWDGSLSISERWFEYLAGLGHPCCIVHEKRDYDNDPHVYSVWRIGEESVATGTRSPAANREEITGKVIQMANGWRNE